MIKYYLAYTKKAQYIIGLNKDFKKIYLFKKISHHYNLQSKLRILHQE